MRKTNQPYCSREIASALDATLDSQAAQEVLADERVVALSVASNRSNVVYQAVVLFNVHEQGENQSKMQKGLMAIIDNTDHGTTLQINRGTEPYLGYKWELVSVDKVDGKRHYGFYTNDAGFSEYVQNDLESLQGRVYAVLIDSFSNTTGTK